jgi:hypothetical protein
MPLSSERSVNTEFFHQSLLIAEVYETGDPSFELLHATSEVDGCVRCLEAVVDALVLFREPPPAAMEIVSAAAYARLEPRVAAVTLDNELVVGLCTECLKEFCSLEVLPN